MTQSPETKVTAATHPATHHVTARDGVMLAVHELGSGPAVLLLHGLFSDAAVNWVKYGHAALIAAAGYRVLMPDLRGHGQSDAPHDLAAWPADVLARDVADVVAHFALDHYVLGGFSLGARTSVRAVASGLVRPDRLILGGMGLQGLVGTSQRSGFFRECLAEFDTAKRGDDSWMAIQFMKTMKIDRIAAALLLDTFVDTGTDALAALALPVLVICGDKDFDNGSAADLAAAIPGARHTTIPGTHMSSVTEAALGQGIVAFLDAPAA